MIVYLVEHGKDDNYPELFRIVEGVYLTEDEAVARREQLRPLFPWMVIRELGVGDSHHHEVY